MTDPQGLTRRRAIATAAAGALIPASNSWAKPDGFPEKLKKIDAYVEHFRIAREIPGLSVTIIAPNQPVFAKGYGLRVMGQKARVDIHTRFGIASNSKAFTAAALALLVDEGKIEWDKPVRTYLPEFKMYDPAVTEMMTVRDLLTHRSGLPLGAGDLMFFPPGTHTAQDVLTALAHLKPVRGFRAGCDYDNVLYIVAGLLIERITGAGWPAFVASRIFAPLGMNDTVGSRFLLTDSNVAGRHVRLGPPVRGMGDLTTIAPDEPEMIYAAGGINSSAIDIAQWLKVQLAGGLAPSGTRLWSKVQADEMWKPQTLTSSTPGPTPERPTRAVLSAYALGWGVTDYRGHRLIAHSGGLSGQVTQTAMLPESGLGVAVFTNVEDGSSGALRNAILDILIDAPSFDWLGYFARNQAKAQKDALDSLGASLTSPPAGSPSLPLDAYVGLYRDSWYGDVRIARADGGLTIDFLPTPVFKSSLESWGTDSFRTHFAKDAGEDAILTFTVESGRVQRLTMKALSPMADFSYDFHHLDFAPVIN
jgi:CubicO group peptidase (beta-lactamase class C family)